MKIKSYVHRGRVTKSQQNALAKGNNLLLNHKINLHDQWDITPYSGLCVEIGCGTGSTLLHQARSYNNLAFIGIDIYAPGLGKIIRQASKEKLQNLRCIQADHNEAFTHCINDASVNFFFIFFPDPWPKKKHHKRRLITVDFIQQLQKKLKADGELWIATDWHNYAQQIITVMSSQSTFLPALTSQAPHRDTTKFEQKAFEDSRIIYEQCWKKDEHPILKKGQDTS